MTDTPPYRSLFPLHSRSLRSNKSQTGYDVIDSSSVITTFKCSYIICFSCSSSFFKHWLRPLILIPKAAWSVVPPILIAATPVDAQTATDGWCSCWFLNFRCLFRYSSITAIVRDFPTPPPPDKKIWKGSGGSRSFLKLCNTCWECFMT